MTLAYLQTRGPGPGLRGRARGRGCSAGPRKAGEGLALEAAWPSPAGAAWPFGSASRLRLQTWARAHSRPLPPTPPAFYAIRVLAPAALALPALPTSLSGMSKRESPTELPVKEIETASPTLCCPGPRPLPSAAPLATVPPQRAQTAPLLTGAEQSPCLSSKVSDLLLRFLESLLPSPPPGRGTDYVKIRFLLMSKTGKFHVKAKGE